MKESAKKFVSGKRSYSTPTVIPIACGTGSPLLAGSFVNNSKIEAVGQELGPTYDLNAPGSIDENTDNTFSLEWETGTN